MKNSDIKDEIFREAVEAIDGGQPAGLKQLLNDYPQLVTKRLQTPDQEGYFRDPYLLWFVANNPIRSERLPDNIVELASLIIDALKHRNDSNYGYIIDYTLSLVVTAKIPRECGVQIPLMELLIQNGAAVKGTVLAAIAERNFEAATCLLKHGAEYNLATAVGLGKEDDVRKLISKATPAEQYVALVVAAYFGKTDLAALLLKAGADPNSSVDNSAFGGFHAHATPLHQAVAAGSTDLVKMLLDADADTQATDRLFNGTPVGWARHLKAEAKDEASQEKFAEIERMLANRLNK